VATESGPAIDPIHQFALKPVVSILVGGHDVSLTNSGLYMLLAVALTCLLVAIGARGGSACRAAAGNGRNGLRIHRGYGAFRRRRVGHAVFPVGLRDLFLRSLVEPDRLYSLLVHGDEPAHHHRGSGADGVFHGYRYRHQRTRLHFFKLFVPPGVPIYILPLVVAIEIISFLSRPISHSVRLFANMLAGHITLNVFGGFVVMLLGASAAVKALAVLPFLMTIGLDALELLVAFLQAYVFAMLTCMYSTTPFTLSLTSSTQNANLR